MQPSRSWSIFFLIMSTVGIIVLAYDTIQGAAIEQKVYDFLFFAWASIMARLYE